MDLKFQHPVVLLSVQLLKERRVLTEFGSLVYRTLIRCPLTLVVFDGQNNIAVFLEGGLGSVLKCKVLDQLANLTLRGYHMDYVVNTFPIVSAHLDKIFKLLVSVELDWRCLANLTELGCLGEINLAWKLLGSPYW